MAAKSTEFGLGAVLYGEDKLSGPLRTVGRAFNLFNAQAGQAAQMTVTVGDSMQILQGTMMKARGVISGTQALVASASNLEARMLEVSKTTGLEGKALQSVTSDILTLSKKIPVTADGLSDIAIAAGQMGISAREDISDFTRIVAQMAAASVYSTEEAGLSLGRLRSIFELTIPQVEQMGSAMAGLADSFAVNEREIGDIAQRLGPTAKAAGITVQETLGLAAAMRDLGIGVEVAGTNMGLIIGKMARDLPKFAKAVGMPTAAFEELFREKPAQALDEFFKAFSTMDKIQAEKKLEELGLTGGRIGVIIKGLGQNSANLAKAYRIANDQFERGTRLQEEAAKQSKGLNARTVLLKNRVAALGIEIGQVFIPFMKLGISLLNALLWVVELIPRPLLALGLGLAVIVSSLILLIGATGLFALKLKTVVPVMQASVVWTLILAAAKQKLTVAQLRQLATMKSLMKVFTLQGLKTKILALWTGFLTVAQWLLNVAMSANPIGLVVVAVIAAIAAYYLLWKALRSGSLILKAWAVSVLIMMGPLGHFILFLGFLAEVWDSNFMWMQDILEEFGTRVSSIVAPISEAWDELQTAISELFDAVFNAFVGLVGSPEKFADAVNSAIEWILEPIRLLGAAFTAVFKEMAAGIKWVAGIFASMTEDNFEEKIDELIEWIEFLPETIYEFFEKLPGLISGSMEESAGDGGSAFFDTLKKIVPKLFKAFFKILWALLKIIPKLILLAFAGLGEAILGLFGTTGKGLFEAGVGLVEAIYDGIKSAWNWLVEKFTDLLWGLRDLLPFSDAKEGPFSNLTESGMAIIETIIAGMKKVATIPAAVFKTIFGSVSDLFIDGLNSTIGVINSLISVANKFIPGKGVPLIPRIEKTGGVAGAGGGGGGGARPAGGETGGGRGGFGPITVVVPITIDGQEVARVVKEITEAELIRSFERPLLSARGVL